MNSKCQEEFGYPGERTKRKVRLTLWDVARIAKNIATPPLAVKQPGV